MLGNGKMVGDMVSEGNITQMALFTTENLSKINNTEKEEFCMMTVLIMKDNGPIIKQMVKGFMSMQMV